MKHICTILILSLTIGSSQAQQSESEAVASTVELFRKTMVDPDQATFGRLTSDFLSYGHSSGLIEDKRTCIASMVSGKFNFESIDLTNQTISIIGNTAVVRHDVFARTHDMEKQPSTVRLAVLMIWIKQRQEWVLLARQAVKM